MSRFLIFYFIVYGGSHIYFFVKLRQAFKPFSRWQWPAGMLLLTFFLAPLMARFLDKHGLETSAATASQLGYWWMGLLFLFISMSVFLDLLQLLSRLAAKYWLHSLKTSIPPFTAFILPACYALLIGIYGWNEANNIRTEHLTIKTTRIPSAAGTIRIAMISDVHIGQIMSERRIGDILAKIKASSPDLLLSAGDLVDGHQRHFAGLDRLFREIEPRLGKVAIPGNHEYYVGIEESLRFMRSAGFLILRDQNLFIGSNLAITGIDDPRHGGVEKRNGDVESRLLREVPPDRFRLLLKHRPVLEQASRGEFDLQLSGHVHKGQIFPFNLLTWLSFPVRSGLTRFDRDSALYVSRGTGVWGPPIRFLAPPEVTIIDLVSAR